MDDGRFPVQTDWWVGTPEEARNRGKVGDKSFWDMNISDAIWAAQSILEGIGDFPVSAVDIFKEEWIEELPSH